MIKTSIAKFWKFDKIYKKIFSLAVSYNSFILHMTSYYINIIEKNDNGYQHI